MVDKLAVEAGSLENKATSLAMDMSKTNQNIYMVTLVRDESPEKNKRTKNIVGRGLPENNKKEDQDLARDVETMRLGRKEGEPKMTPLRVTLKNQETTNEILRKSAK